MIVLSIALFIAIALIVFLTWYSVNAVRKIQSMVDAIEDVDLAVDAFERHLKHIYSLDMYYGDQTLESLINHMKELSEQFTEFREDYAIFNGDLDEQDFFEKEDNAASENDSGKDILLKRS